MVTNRLLGLSIVALAMLGCGAAGMLEALQRATMADMRTGRTRLAAVRSLADLSQDSRPYHRLTAFAAQAAVPNADAAATNASLRRSALGQVVSWQM